MNNEQKYDGNPALNSLKQFGSMVSQPIAKGLSYLNPLDANRRITQGITALPDAMKRYDAAYGERVRADLAQPSPNYFPTPFNNSRPTPPGMEVANPNKVTAAPSVTPSVSRNRSPQTNATPIMQNNPMHDVNLKKYDYSTGMAFTPEQLNVHRQEQQQQQKLANVNRPSVYDGQQITPSNWRSPGKRYNDLNKAELLDENGYPAYVDGQQVTAPLFDNSYMQKRYGKGVYRPRTEEQRMLEGMESHNRVLRGIAAYQNLNHYRRTGEDKQFPVQGGYDLSGPDPKQIQQQFENELDVRRLGLNIQKRNDSLHPDPVKNKYKPRYSDVYDDNFNITGSRFDGSFNESTGEWISAGQDTASPILDEDTFNMLSRAKELSGRSDKALTKYQQLLMELGLPLNWDSDYEE